MPNLVVYVPAGLARELDARGVSLEEQRRACHAAVKALVDGELAAGVASTAAHGESRVTGSPPSSPPAASSQERSRVDGPGRAAGREPSRGSRGADMGANSVQSGAPASRSARCPADTPRGVRCKLCGEKH